MMGGGASFIEGTLSRVASINSGLLVCSIQLYMYTRAVYFLDGSLLPSHLGVCTMIVP
jgi:hypothetical protein